MTGIAMFLAFLFLHHAYIRDIIYEERLNQMEEITHQMFQNLFYPEKYPRRRNLIKEDSFDQIRVLKEKSRF